MSTDTFNLVYDGYWQVNPGDAQQIPEDVPREPGVYSVYLSRFFPEQEGYLIMALLYIGEAENVWERVRSHGGQLDWERHLASGDELCFNFAPVSDRDDRERIEAALIHAHRPLDNTEHTKDFRFPDTTITTEGINEFLDRPFTVQRSS